MYLSIFVISYLARLHNTILFSDDEILIRCLDREEYYADLRNYERAIAEKEQKLGRGRIEHDQDLRNYKKAIAVKEQELEQNREYYEAQIRELHSEIEQLKKQSQC